MLTENEKQKLIKDLGLIIVAAGGIVTLAYAIYFIVDTLKKWYS
jgi:ATP-dependent protease ClpP protease subunit